MRKQVSGLCPKQNKEANISVDYIESPNFSEITYIKGKVNCDYENRLGCDYLKCPLYKSLPQNL